MFHFRGALQSVLLTLSVMILLIGSTVPSATVPSVLGKHQSPEGMQARARELWEQAIVAKGGRERLYAENNLQVSIRDSVWQRDKRAPYIEEDLYVFPNKSWEWNDQRETMFGFSLRVFNGDRNLHLWYSDHGKGISVGTPADYVGGRSGLVRLYDIQLRYLMETRWVKPIPIRVEKGKIGGQPVDIVQTLVKGYPTRDGDDKEKIGFALDPQTHLPLQVIYYTVTSDKEYSGGVPLSDYAEVAGIKMPSKVSGLRSNYQINVDYDRRIFEQPPNVVAGIEQWKTK
jgi:hypothetical protein